MYHFPRKGFVVQSLGELAQLCKDSGMGPDEIAQATGHSKLLVREYLDLIEEFQLPPLANLADADSVQAGQASTPNGT